MRLRPGQRVLPRSAIAAVPSIGRAVHVERAAREADATQDLYERYSGQIFGFCVNKLGSRDEAEDALQSTFLNAHRALQRGITPESELAWLFTIAHNVCLTRHRSTRRRGRVESPSDFAAVQDIVPAPSRESSDDLVRLTDALAEMPDSQRHAILLREWQGLSYAEIADAMELSQSAVETLIFRARRTLAANLQSESDRRPGLLGRVRKAFDASALLMALKGLLGGGAAAKVAAVAVATSGAALLATAPAGPLAKDAPSAHAATSLASVAPAGPAESQLEPTASRVTPLTATRQQKVAALAAPLVKQAPAVSGEPGRSAPKPAAVHASHKATKTEPKGQARKQVPAAKAHAPLARKKERENASTPELPAPAKPKEVAPVKPEKLALAPAPPVEPPAAEAADNGAEHAKGSKK